MPTGATVAALTTSLPETPGGERNWDYRFTWIRDTTFTLQALHWLTLDWEADEFMQFVADLEANEDGALQIMYGIDGRRDLTESTLDKLSGYAGAKPVRIGNGAFDQRQNDVFGAVLDSVYIHTRSSERVPRRLWPIVESQGKCAEQVWREPDQGIWEARGDPQHYVSSKLMCWVAMDRAAKLANIRSDTEMYERWNAVAEEIRADILRARHARRRAATALRHRLAGCIDAAGGDLRVPARHGRGAAKERSCDRRRTDRGRLRPALPHRRDRRRPVGQGRILPDLLLLARLGARRDRRAAAGPRPDGKLLAVASPLGLYAEEFDSETGRHLGNFPQAFSHLALIEAAARIFIAEELAEFDMTESYDVIVIGSGAGGGTLVRHLAPSGKRILLLERGDWLPREPQNWLVHDVFVDNRYISQDTWYDAETQRHSNLRSTTSSAARRSSTARRSIAYAAEDFGELRHHDGDLARVADRLRRDGALLHAGRGALPGARRAGEDPTEPPASAPYAFPAVSHEPRIQRLSDDLEEAGLPPVPRALRGDVERGEHAEQQCVRCSTCDGFPCLVHGKSDAEVIGVRPALEHPNVTLLTNACALALRTNSPAPL